jgi:hypothetical protein
MMFLNLAKEFEKNLGNPEAQQNGSIQCFILSSTTPGGQLSALALRHGHLPDTDDLISVSSKESLSIL